MKSQPTTVKLSIGFLAIVCILIIVIAGLGAFIGSKITAPRPTTQTTTDDTRTVVPVSQQITVSPSKLRTDIVVSKSKSTVLLAHQTSKGITPFGMGVIITNDGVIISPQSGEDAPVIAIGNDAVSMSVTAVGQDALTGLYFFRLDHSLVTPIELSQLSPQVGTALLAVFRSHETMRSGAMSSILSQIIPYANTDTPGIQQIGEYQKIAATLPIGTPLLDEDGRLAGLIMDADTQTILLVSDIKSAIARLSSNALSYNPYKDFGFTIAWKLQQDAQSHIAIKAEIQSVTPLSQAAAAGLKIGDSVVNINNNAITWDSDIQSLLSGNELHINVLRADQPKAIVITKKAS